MIADLPRDRLMAEFSLWSADLANLEREMARIEPHADLMHVDVADGVFAPSFLFFPDLVARLAPLTRRPIHVHLMVEPAIVEAQVGLGRTLWVGTSIDDSWMRSGVPYFLPVLLEEAALHLTQADEPPRAVEVGEVLEAVLPRGAAAEKLRAPGGREVTLTRAAVEGGAVRPRVTATDTGVAGPCVSRGRPARARGPSSRAGSP